MQNMKCPNYCLLFWNCKGYKCAYLRPGYSQNKTPKTWWSLKPDQVNGLHTPLTCTWLQGRASSGPWGEPRVEGPGWEAGVRCSEKATHPCQPDSGLEPAPLHVKIHSGRFPSTKQNDFFKKPVVYEILDSLWLPGPNTLHATWGESPNTHKTCVLIRQT